MFADFQENIGILTMIVNYPEQMYTVAKVTNIFTMAKWGFMITTLVMILFGLVALAVSNKAPGPGKK